MIGRLRRAGVARAGVARAPAPLSPADSHHLRRRRAAALRLVARGTPVAALIESAPPAYVFVHGASDIARHCGLLSPVPSAREVRALVTPGRVGGEWHLDVGARDRPGLLAAFTGVLFDAAIEVIQSVLATWEDGAALQAFVVRSPTAPRSHDLQALLEASLDRPLSSPPVPDATLQFDNEGSSLYTACRLRAPDRPGLLHAVATAIASVGGDVQAARVDTIDGTADDRFDLSDRAGQKLTLEMQAAVRRAVAEGVTTAPRPVGRAVGGGIGPRPRVGQRTPSGPPSPPCDRLPCPTRQ